MQYMYIQQLSTYFENEMILDYLLPLSISTAFSNLKMSSCFFFGVLSVTIHYSMPIMLLYAHLDSLITFSPPTILPTCLSSSILDLYRILGTFKVKRFQLNLLHYLLVASPIKWRSSTQKYIEDNSTRPNITF